MAEAETGEVNVQLEQTTSVDLDRDLELDAKNIPEGPKSRLRLSRRRKEETTASQLRSSSRIVKAKDKIKKPTGELRRSSRASNQSKSEPAAVSEGSPETKKIEQADTAPAASQENESQPSPSKMSGQAGKVRSTKNKNSGRAASAGTSSVKKSAKALSLSGSPTKISDVEAAAGSSVASGRMTSLFAREARKPKTSTFKIPMHTVLKGLIVPIKITVRDGGYPPDFEVDVDEIDDQSTFTLNARVSAEVNNSAPPFPEPSNQGNDCSAMIKDAGAAIRKALTIKETASTLK